MFHLDGDADLNTPQEGWGVLDSCGVAHLLGNGDPQLAALRPDGPLLDPAALVLFGFHPAQLSAGQWRRFAGHGLYGVRSPACHQEPPGAAHSRPGPAARQARPAVSPGRRCHRLRAVPAGRLPRYHGRLSLADVFDAVAAAAAHPGLACLTLTEVNPDHEPTGELSQELVSRWTATIAAGLTR